MHGNLNQAKKRQWSQQVVHLVHTYNSTTSDTMGYPPYFLMFGREARLHVHLCFGTKNDDDGERQHSSYVTKLKQYLQKAYQTNRLHLRKEGLRKESEVSKPRSWRSSNAQNLAFTGQHKLQNRWRAIPYVVTEKIPDLPVTS